MPQNLLVLFWIFFRLLQSLDAWYLGQNHNMCLRNWISLLESDNNIIFMNYIDILGVSLDDFVILRILTLRNINFDFFTLVFPMIHVLVFWLPLSDLKDWSLFAKLSENQVMVFE